MKRVLMLTLFASTVGSVFGANRYEQFQKFDNHVSFGINYQNGNFDTQQANGNPNEFSMTSLNLEVEKLFDIGLWGNFNASIAQTYTETNGSSSFSGQPSSAALGSNPYLQTMNLKLGYHFPLVQGLAVIPYVNLGKNTNLTMYTSTSGIFQNINVTNSFYYALGGGLRLEYVVNKYAQLYLDQLFTKNLDQTTFNVGDTPVVNTSNNQWTTTLGVRVNPWEKLQLGANLFYTNYNDYSPGSIQSLENNGFGTASVPTTTFGFQLSAGFTFE